MKKLIILLLILGFLPGCTLFRLVQQAPGHKLGDKIDNACMLAKISEVQAEVIAQLPFSGAIEPIPWDQLEKDAYLGKTSFKGYNDDMLPRKPQRGDRIMTHECANAIRETFGQNPTR